MMKITLAVAAAAAVLTTAPLATPAKAQGVKMAQGVDVQIGRDRDDRYYRGPSPVRLRHHSWHRLRWCHHRPTTALPHGDYHD